MDEKLVINMDEKLVKEYKAMLPGTDTLESIVAKGQIRDVMINARLWLLGIKKDEFIKWKENPMKFVWKHNQTAYEKLVAVGYHPQLRELMGVIYIKRQYGYGGSCPNGFGSPEYVRFYVDWTNNGNFTDLWENQGLGRVHVFDPRKGNVNKLPIEYAVRKGTIMPKKLLSMLESICAVRRVRAILSWAIIPPAGQPNWKPFWGNVVETNIRFHR